MPRLKAFAYRCMLVRDEPLPDQYAKAPADMLPVVTKALEGYDVQGKECFGVVYLSARHKVIGTEILSIGCLTASLVHPREVFRGAVSLPCAALVLFHNHPSGDPSPSAEDMALTRRMAAAGSLMGIEVLDHVVVAVDDMAKWRMVSLKERGVL